jgi:hypothetical protein
MLAREMASDDLRELKQEASKALRDFKSTGLRWSYLVIGAMVLIGLIVNIFLPHGWVIWPAVLAIGMMTMIHEAAERNNEGVPPFQAYSWFAGALAVWMGISVFLSKIGIVLFIVGLPVLVVYCVRTYIVYRKRAKQNAERREKGLCIFCGEALDPRMGTFCVQCGQTDEEEDLRRRMRDAVTERSVEDIAHTRAALKPESPAAAARRKEQELLERRQRRSAAQRQASERRTKLEGGES